jgi:predicted RecB family nuclease
MKLTSALFEAYLKCPTKCYLRSTGQTGVGNAYADWVRERNDAYRKEGVQRLMSAAGDGVAATTPGTDNLKTATWLLAVDLPFETETMASRLHAVERVPSEGRGKPAQFIPVRFVFLNKLTKDDRVLVAFDALVLSEVLGREVSVGKIIHGDDHATLKVKIPGLLNEARKLVGKLTESLVGASPPDLVLNRHCGECEFRDGCRQKAVEKDDLSLLAGMSAQERQRLRSKGIFTVTQLSYTFRPRRRPKKLRDKREKYHHSLKALAIREKKIHIVGRPEFKIEGTPVYLDVEGVPDRDFYYLIGMRIGHGESAVEHSLWADTVEDEGKIWREFHAILETVEKPVLIHYGNYETDFIEKLTERYGNSVQSPSDSAVKHNTINLLSSLLDEIYFPTFSNGLKDIGGWLGFMWSKGSPVGVDSIACRYVWERARDVSKKDSLIAYNAEDCRAAELVTRALLRLQTPESSEDAGECQSTDTVYVRSLKPPRKRFGMFKSPVEEFKGISETTWWDYQRDRIYLKSQRRVSRAAPVSDGAKLGPRKKYRPNKVVKLPVQASCPFCGGACVPLGYKRRTLQDLYIGKSGIKRWVVMYKFRNSRCPACQKRYGMPDGFWTQSNFGRNLAAYLLYENFDLGIPILTVSKMMFRFFGFEMSARTLYMLRDKAAKYYQNTFDAILKRLVSGNLLHVDETQASVEGKSAYVWVFADDEQVAFLYNESRDGCFLQEMLKGFKGVLVTDFYGVYDSLPCRQQKCLIHLMRDLNDFVLCNPYDDELKNLVREFGRLLKSIVETVRRRGLQTRYLRKHVKSVKRFYKTLDQQTYQSEAAHKCKQRFDKNRDKLFTFLNCDGIPWHNNNAEHAIKSFARHRDIVRGSFTPGTIQKHLVLLSICQTCKYTGVDFLDFLRSGEKDIHAFAESRRSHRRGR